jgi:hypothetical protein
MDCGFLLSSTDVDVSGDVDERCTVHQLAIPSIHSQEKVSACVVSSLQRIHRYQIHADAAVWRYW